MTPEKLVLACMTASKGVSYEPVQIQKLIFLFQENAKPLFRSKPFSFKPHAYGPFDPRVYTVLEKLAAKGFTEIIGQPYDRRRLYKLADAGHETAKEALNSISEPYKSYLIDLSAWVHSLPFAQLVGAVYKAYPKMRANSIFQG